MTEQQKKIGGCYAIFIFLGTISGLLLVIAAVFQMPSYMFFWTAIWIAACICIALVIDNLWGVVLCEACTLIYYIPWLDLVKSIDLFKEKYKTTINPAGYIAPFFAAFILWYIGAQIQSAIWLSKNHKEEKAECQEQLDTIEAEMAEKTQKQAEEVDAQTEPPQTIDVKPAEPVLKPAPEPVQSTNTDEEEKRAAEEARRAAEEAQKQAEEARRRVEEAQKQAERAAKRMEDAMQRAKLAQEQLKKAQAEAEKLKNQNKNP